MLQHVVEEHIEEFELLWHIRQRAVHSPDYALHEMGELEARMMAQTKALAYAGEQLVPLLISKLQEDDPVDVFAAAYTLLCLDTEPSAEYLATAFLQAEGEQLDGICTAFCQGSIDRVSDVLKDALDSAPPPVAVAAAEVLAFHGKLDSSEARLAEFYTDEDPRVRRRAWRIVSLLGQS